MDIDKVIRILIVSLIIIAIAIRAATRLLFPDCEPTGNFPIAVLLAIGLLNICHSSVRNNRSDQ